MKDWWRGEGLWQIMDGRLGSGRRVGRVIESGVVKTRDPCLRSSQRTRARGRSSIPRKEVVPRLMEQGKIVKGERGSILHV